jgi:hypothetical protein
MQSVLLQWLQQGRQSAQPSLKPGTPESSSVSGDAQVVIAPVDDGDSSDSQDPVSRGARRYIAAMIAERNKDCAATDTSTAEPAQSVHDEPDPPPGNCMTQTL